jgi:uncharacterized membrane protein YphA (DoxX/SURF4 family)
MNVLPSMNNRLKCALIGLRWSLAIVIFIEAALFLFGPQSRHSSGAMHMPAAIWLILGWGEIAGSILVLIPRVAAKGAWLLLAMFLFAIVIHLLHGMTNVGALVIYSAAAWVVASSCE